MNSRAIGGVLVVRGRLISGVTNREPARARRRAASRMSQAAQQWDFAPQYQGALGRARRLRILSRSIRRRDLKDVGLAGLIQELSRHRFVSVLWLKRTDRRTRSGSRSSRAAVLASRQALPSSVEIPLIPQLVDRFGERERSPRRRGNKNTQRVKTGRIPGRMSCLSHAVPRSKRPSKGHASARANDRSRESREG